MNDYFLYKHLCEIENIASQYNSAAEFCDTVKNTAWQISSQTYRVAVIGGFKRGKSSLVNAIIGTNILPTDVLPMTAAVTRVIYGSERRILIKYKDGNIQEGTVEELIDFATKYDLKKEETALSVREIEVSYPSVFCKNHIEIIDTPGLNDNESMSAVTLSVIGDVDAAIVVISAKEPLSLTEQNLIVDLIRQQGIRHIIFVVTFIDVMKSDKDKDKIINFISGRISKEVFELAVNDDSIDSDKAGNILKNPAIFGVSSSQAMDSFVNGNEDLLKESRFPQFKQELFALLTAAQSADLIPKTALIVNKAQEYLPEWVRDDENILNNQEHELTEYIKAVQDYAGDYNNALIGFMRQMDTRLAEMGITDDGVKFESFESTAKKIFIKNLTKINSETYKHKNILDALNNAAAETKQTVAGVGRTIETNIRQTMETVICQFTAVREKAGLSDNELNKKQSEATRDFPMFEWVNSLTPDVFDLCGVDVMPYVCDVLKKSLDAYSKNIITFIKKWRVVLLNQYKRDVKALPDTTEYEKKLETIRKRRTALQVNSSKHIEDIKVIKQKIKEAEG